MNHSRSFHKSGRFEAIGVFVIALAGIVMAVISWQKWCDPIIDFGHELYTPWALCQGQCLYKDINIFFYGPLSYYINALLFELFGTHINVIIYFNLLLILVTTYIIYKIVHTASNSLCAFFCALSFLVLFAFPRHQIWGNFNFVTPYAHAATHGIILSFLALLLVSNYMHSNKLTLGYGCWLSVGLVLLTKVEIFVGIFFSMVVTWGWLFCMEKPPFKVLLARLMIFLVLLLFPLLLFVVFFSRRFSFIESVLYILSPYFASFRTDYAFNTFLIRVMGIDDPLPNIHQMLSVLAVYTSITLIILAINHFFNTVSKNNKYQLMPHVLAFLIMVPIIGGTVAGDLSYFECFRALPIILTIYLVYLIFTLKKAYQYGFEWKRNLIFLSLSVFSIVLLTRKILNVDLFHYGFFLVLPAFLVLLIIALHELPILMKMLSGDARIGMIPVLVLIVCTLYSYFSCSVRYYNIVNTPIRINQEVIKTLDPQFNNRASMIEDALHEISACVKPGETFTVFPEGIMFNYLTRRHTPIPYTAFIPPFLAVFGNSILESLQETSPHFVVLVERATREYGSGCRCFGTDYGTDILQWIKENYVEIWQIGKKPLSGQGFGIIIMKRISSQALQQNAIKPLAD